MPHQFFRRRERRNALCDLSSVTAHTNVSSQQRNHNKLTERIRELEEEIVPDVQHYQLSPVYSPFTPVTPCSNGSPFGIPSYPYSVNFPMNIISTNSPVPTQRYGLSPKIIERAHNIPERFWIDWQEKQLKNRIEELESIKNKLTNSNEPDLKQTTQLHSRCNTSPPQSAPFERIPSTNTDNETSPSISNIRSLFSFDQPSIDKANCNNRNSLDTSMPLKSIATPSPSIPKTQSTLDRSRLTIFLPKSNVNLPEKITTTNKHDRFKTQSLSDKVNPIKNHLIQRFPTANSVEDIANIDTELNLTLLLRENRDQTNPLLYSKVTINRTIEFQSLSSKKDPSI